MQALLKTLLDRDSRPLNLVRSPENRLFVSCRHYALLGASILRSKGMPTRLGVGFANYFNPGFAEDHWVCEYREDSIWKLHDVELDTATRDQFKILFSPHNLPRDQFLSAAAAWREMRRGELDQSRIGVSAIGITGDWFAASGLLRDAAALAMEEMQPWDYWGPGRDFVAVRGVPPDWLEPLDHLAEALAREPQTLADAKSVCSTYPWAALTPTVLSFPLGEPAEQTVA